MTTLMKFSEIPELEREAIRYLIEADGVPEELRAQIESVRTVARSESSVGVYVDFDLDGEVPLPAGEADFEIAGLSATGSGGDEVEFILFVRGGRLSCLEVYTVLPKLPPYASLMLSPGSDMGIQS